MTRAAAPISHDRQVPIEKKCGRRIGVEIILAHAPGLAFPDPLPKPCPGFAEWSAWRKRNRSGSPGTGGGTISRIPASAWRRAGLADARSAALQVGTPAKPSCGRHIRHPARMELVQLLYLHKGQAEIMKSGITTTRDEESCIPDRSGAVYSAVFVFPGILQERLRLVAGAAAAPVSKSPVASQLDAWPATRCVLVKGDHEHIRAHSPLCAKKYREGYDARGMMMPAIPCRSAAGVD